AFPARNFILSEIAHFDIVGILRHYCFLFPLGVTGQLCLAGPVFFAAIVAFCFDDIFAAAALGLQAG
ncbi:MAG: hypothetical protein ACK559_13185, partial [bacterium]